MKLAKQQSGGWFAGVFRLVTSSFLASLLVLHCLSLDAVSVLLAYQFSLDKWAGVDLPAFVYVTLGMGIWLGYTADRLKDVNPKRQSLASTLRHQFHRQHRSGLLLSWWLVFALAVVSGWFGLPRPAFYTGCFFAIFAAAYVFGVSRQKRTAREGPRLLKRFFVALLLGGSGLWWWFGWGYGSWPDTQLFVLVALFVIFASWELILLEGRRIRVGSFASFWIRWGAPLAIAAIAWPLGMVAYASLLFGVIGFSVISQLSGSWPNELKSLFGDSIILLQFLLLAWLA